MGLNKEACTKYLLGGNAECINFYSTNEENNMFLERKTREIESNRSLKCLLICRGHEETTM